MVEEATGVLRAVQVEDEEASASRRPKDLTELVDRMPIAPASAAATANGAANAASSFERNMQSMNAYYRTTTR